jgi:hypothetical protein
MISVNSLMQPIPVADAKASIYNVLAQLGTPTGSWKPGAVVRTIVYLVAVFFSATSSVIAMIARMGYQSTATGDWATVNAQEVYGITRTAATYASGTVKLTNALGGVYALDIGQLTVQNTATNAQYTNSAAFSLGAGPGANVDVPIVATLSGIGSNAIALAITTIVTPMVGVSCSNSAALSAVDAQSDEDLYIETQEAMDSNSPDGPANAYAYVVRGRGGKDAAVAAIGVNRVQTFNSGTTGLVTVYVATASGAVTSPDIAILNTAVQTWAMPLCVTPTVASATPATYLPLDVAVDVHYYQIPGLSDSEIVSKCTAAITAYLQAQPIGGNPRRSDDPGYGGRLYIDAIRGVCQGGAGFAIDPSLSTSGLGIFTAEITLSDGDAIGVEVDPGHVIIPGTITVTPYGMPPTWQ